MRIGNGVRLISASFQSAKEHEQPDMEMMERISEIIGIRPSLKISLIAFDVVDRPRCQRADRRFIELGKIKPEDLIVNFYPHIFHNRLSEPCGDETEVKPE